MNLQNTGRHLVFDNGAIMSLKRILLVSRKNLFTSGLEKLLKKRFTHRVWRIDPAEPQTLAAQIWQYRPCLVIMNTLDLRQPVALLAHLQTFPAFQLIVVNEYDNEIIIYPHSGSSLTKPPTSHIYQQSGFLQMMVENF